METAGATGHSVKRFPFLDWMRGLAVVVMIQCHTFNSLVRIDLRNGGPYVLSQFVGGMAAPLFLFMAGITMGFQMESLEKRELRRLHRWLVALRRGAYILGIAFTFRLTNYVFSLPRADAHEIIRVDILNCMGVGMIALAMAAVFDSASRVRFAVAAGLAIAAVSPVVANWSWSSAPALLHEYLAPTGGGRFPFFPTAAYLPFGLAVGTIVKRAPADRFERLMQWSVLLGLGLIFVAQYLSNVPYSIYAASSFWTDSPTLILIRVGISLLIMAASYLWTEYCAGPGWSWMQCLGRNSLMVYWVHVMLVYGDIAKPLKRKLDIPQAVLATAIVTGLMVALSAAWLWWKARRAGRQSVFKNAISPALSSGESFKPNS
jgi:uncharacterized membrane protein